MRLRELGQPIGFALPIILQMMLSDDLTDHRIGKNLLREFFPQAMQGLKYNCLMPSKEARARLVELLASYHAEQRGKDPVGPGGSLGRASDHPA